MTAQRKKTRKMEALEKVFEDVIFTANSRVEIAVEAEKRGYSYNTAMAYLRRWLELHPSARDALDRRNQVHRYRKASTSYESRYINELSKQKELRRQDRKRRIRNVLLEGADANYATDEFAEAVRQTLRLRMDFVPDIKEVMKELIEEGLLEEKPE